ncbi:hypothetical protein [Burkholderia sp. BCC0405]|uniref:hypothetical protein n=1 Tax=Burkholderia sp. BCC0405 TaxID=2676298 RepID=UPI001FC83C6D|nr:hypothetical protein [Burkholderia sp. BCC0405]
MDSEGQRVTYEVMKAEILSLYYIFCRDRGISGKFSHREVLGYIELECEDIYERPIEILMLRVIQLILSGGWHPRFENWMRKIISEQISTEGLGNLLKELPTDEVELFKHDLKILKFIP